ncbi:hypothetical protein ARMSODRAFT_346836 [Armillaria solidipes]|uniref:Uncharacterized protein n=1 Tax=Armillaria solidipes TaxID=1076256 RepID=A0A2H3BD49_9AGAR|nr:hypothetical protein ARMSODRAFT_346836 [Armillaria solidipes]
MSLISTAACSPFPGNGWPRRRCLAECCLPWFFMRLSLLRMCVSDLPFHCYSLLTVAWWSVHLVARVWLPRPRLVPLLYLTLPHKSSSSSTYMSHVFTNTQWLPGDIDDVVAAVEQSCLLDIESSLRRLFSYTTDPIQEYRPAPLPTSPWS